MVCSLGATEGWAVEAARIGAVPRSGDEPSYLCNDIPDLANAGGRVVWVNGRSLWLVDPSRLEMSVLRDLGAGPFPGTPDRPVDADGTAFFTAFDGFSTGLWSSDYTNAGTRLVADMRQISNSSLGVFASFGSRAFFVARDPNSLGIILWMSDGTLSGTVPVPGSLTDPRLPLPTRRALVCATGSMANTGSVIWATDGSQSGVRVLVRFPPPGGVSGMVPFRDGFLAAGTRAGSSWTYELWKSDLSVAGTLLAARLPDPVKVHAHGEWAVSVGDVTLFTLARQDGLQERLSLWRTDGTAAGTRQIIPPGVDSFAPVSPVFFAVLGSAALFAASDAVHGVELWRSDGTDTGTRLVADINPGPRDSSPEWMTVAGNTVYFTAADVFSGRELWVSDGTAGGTRQVVDLCPGPFGSIRSYARRWGMESDGSTHRLLVSAGDRVALVASSGTDGCGFWASDGTAAGTQRIEDVSGGGAAYASSWSAKAAATTPTENLRLLAVDGSVVAQFGQPWAWSALWRTDGVPGVFQELSSPVFPGLFDGPSWPLIHGQLYANGLGTVLRSDGTPAGSVPVFPGSLNRPSRGDMGTAFFWRAGGDLWRTDGTPSGTARVRAFPAMGLEMTQIAQRGGIAYFAANDGAHGAEPWRSDGSEAGTTMIADLCPGSCSSEPSAPVVSGSTVFFQLRMWPFLLATDGTASGSRLVHAAVGGTALPLAGGLLFGDGQGDLSFVSADASEAQRLGTFRSLKLAPYGIPDGTLVAPLLFQAEDDTHGAELWRTDGTPSGTYLVKDIVPGLASSGPYFFVQAFGRTYFTASDGEHGAELWSSDGTEAGTVVVADIEPGPRSSVPLGLTVAGNRLVFELASRPNELWSARVSSLPRVDVSDAWTNRGRLGDGFARISVTLAEPPTSEASVAFATEDDTAKAGVDYLPVGGRLVFPAGSLEPRHAVVPLVASSNPQPTKVFFVRLSEPAGSTIGRGSATVTVYDDRTRRPSPRQRLSRGEQP